MKYSFTFFILFLITIGSVFAACEPPTDFATEKGCELKEIKEKRYDCSNTDFRYHVRSLCDGRVEGYSQLHLKTGLIKNQNNVLQNEILIEEEPINWIYFRKRVIPLITLTTIFISLFLIWWYKPKLFPSKK